MSERGFFDLRKQFVFYASYHNHPVNVFIHLVCIWNLRERPCPFSWSLVIIKINLFLPPVWSGMCLMHFTPQIASSPDILNKVVSLWQHYKSPWLSTLPGSSGGRDTHQPDPGGDRHLRRDLCPDGPRGRVPGGQPGPAPPPLHIWSVSWDKYQVTISWQYHVMTWHDTVMMTSASWHKLRVIVSWIFSADLASANDPVQGYPLWQALLAFHVVMWIVQVNNQYFYFLNIIFCSVYRARRVWGAGPRAAGLLGPGLHHGAALRHPRGPLLPRIQEAVPPGLHERGPVGDWEVQS